jgi:hypothetical protein
VSKRSSEPSSSRTDAFAPSHMAISHTAFGTKLTPALSSFARCASVTGVSARGTSSVTSSLKVRMKIAWPMVLATGPYTATLRSMTSWPSHTAHRRMQPAAMASRSRGISGSLSTMPVASSTVRARSSPSAVRSANTPSRTSSDSTRARVAPAP